MEHLPSCGGQLLKVEDHVKTSSQSSLAYIGHSTLTLPFIRDGTLALNELFMFIPMILKLNMSIKLLHSEVEF